MGMLNLAIAAAIVFGGYWILRQFAYASPTKAAGLIRKLGGLGLMAVAGVFALRGGVIVAVPLFVAGTGADGTIQPIRRVFLEPGKATGATLARRNQPSSNGT